MFKKTIKYEDFDGNERIEDHYFHLTKAEVIEWITTSHGCTLDKVMETLISENNGKEIIKIFKDLIYMSYGKKSPDGRRFIKTEEVKQDFIETEAYSILFTELISDASKAAEFFNSIIPADIASEFERILKENPEGIPEALKDYMPSGSNNSK